MQNNIALFVTYNGLLDQLGSSQILPYLKGISTHPRRVFVISFEKKNFSNQVIENLSSNLEDIDIHWIPMRFSDNSLGKALDLLKMLYMVAKTIYKYNIKIVHCRKLIFKHKVIFDMRGFWFDDRRDSGQWNYDNRIGRAAYYFVKRIELKIVRSSDFIVVLTESASTIVKTMISPSVPNNIYIIPCCADFCHFLPLSEEKKLRSKKLLGIPGDAMVLSYLGSLGGLYLFDRMISFFIEVCKFNKNAYFLIITRDWSEDSEREISKLDIEWLRSKLLVRPASRSEVPLVLGVSDVMLSFYSKGFSRSGTSPTKFAESVAMGIPVISSSKVGDIDTLTKELSAGIVVDLDNEFELIKAAKSLDSIISFGDGLRDRSYNSLDLSIAEELYKELYSDIDKLLWK